MKTEQFTIKNKNGEKIVGLIHNVDNPKGTAIVQHGLGGFKEEIHIMRIVECCIEAGWRTIAFDCRNSFGESDGDINNMTIATYCDDLVTIIEQLVPTDHKLLLAGHSCGAGSVLRYTCDNPDRVYAIAPTAAAISKEFLIEQCQKMRPEFFADWQRDGRFHKVPSLRPEREGYVSYNLVEEMGNMTVLESAPNLTMPLFLIVGTDDKWMSPEQQQALHDKWRGPKEIHIIEGSEHVFKDSHLDQMAEKLSAWLAKLPV